MSEVAITDYEKELEARVTELESRLEKTKVALDTETKLYETAMSEMTRAKSELKLFRAIVKKLVEV